MLKRIIAAKGYTVTSLADKIEYDRSHFSRLINSGKMKDKHYQRIATGIGISKADLLHMLQTGETPDVVREPPAEYRPTASSGHRPEAQDKCRAEVEELRALVVELRSEISELKADRVRLLSIIENLTANK